jgi:hypothetical protein
MPDGNRSECRCLPFSNYNEPPLQQALLEFLISEWPKSFDFNVLLGDERFGAEGRWPLMRAVKSLHIGKLIFFQKDGKLISTEPARHGYWLWTKAEAPDA